jgi:hypothetical protein
LPGEPQGWATAQKGKEALLKSYAESLRQTLLVVRFPKVTYDRALLAYLEFQDDSFLQGTLGPEGWQFWPLIKQLGTTDAWRARPVRGEVRPELQPTLCDNWPNSDGQDVKTAITTTHTTWLLDADLFKTPPTLE